MFLKSFVPVLCLVCASAVLGGQPNDTSKKGGAMQPKGAAQTEQLETVTFPVAGMMCRNCVIGVELTFKKSPGVVNVSADGESSATVKFDPNKTTVEKLITEFNTNKASRFDIYKPGEKITYKYDGKEERLKGKMVLRQANAPKDIVCRILARRNSEKANRFFNLIATGELAAKLEAVRKEGREGIIVGIATEDGFKVTKIE